MTTQATQADDSFDPGKHGRAEDNNGVNLLTETPQQHVIMVLRSQFQYSFAPSFPPRYLDILQSELETRLASRFGATVQPLFDLVNESNAPSASFGSSLSVEQANALNLSLYRQVEAPDNEIENLVGYLTHSPEAEFVDAAYIKPRGEAPAINAMTPAPGLAPGTTPDFTGRQEYLDSAPDGIDARYAWTLSGGRGKNVRIIDLEWAWRLTHEDLKDHNPVGKSALLRGTMTGDYEHGTAVMGVFGGNLNSIGVTGICGEAEVQVVAFGAAESADIVYAANQLAPGDIMLLEIHRPGPRYNFSPRSDQSGYIAVEWWQDDYAAIRHAIGRGILVVEAAGNGGENLDDALYDINPNGQPGFIGHFSSWWVNPFRRTILDAGAIVVGAGSPPPNTHGVTHGEDRSRLDFSNYGAVIDAQGWGCEVTTCGYGDLQGGSNTNRWYTDRFSGTSSASPIIVGALACVQGVLKDRGYSPLTPAEARVLLRGSGSVQQDNPSNPTAPVSQRIGNRPDLKQLLTLALALRGDIP